MDELLKKKFVIEQRIKELQKESSKINTEIMNFGKNIVKLVDVELVIDENFINGEGEVFKLWMDKHNLKRKYLIDEDKNIRYVFKYTDFSNMWISKLLKKRKYDLTLSRREKEKEIKSKVNNLIVSDPVVSEVVC